MNKYLTISFLFTCLFLLQCWNRQDHNVTRPLIPHYLFTGTALDLDSGGPLPESKIKLEGIHMIYEADFGTQIITADSTGFFQFDSVYPGDYKLSMERDGYFINSTDIQMQHSDTSVVLEIPKIKFAQSFSEYGYGIAINGSKAWYLSRAINSPYWWLPNDHITEFKMTRNVWIYNTGHSYRLGETKIFAMSYGREGVYCTVYPDSIYMFNFYDGSIATSFSLGQNIQGIGYHITKQAIVTSFKNKIFVHEKDKPTQISQTYYLDHPSLRALAYYRGLWVWDNSDNLLMQLDDDMNVLHSFALLKGKDGIQITSVYDMSFDGYGELWVVGEYVE